MEEVELIVMVVLRELCGVASRLAWHVKKDVMRKLQRYEEEGVDSSWKERSDELVRPILDCLALLEKIIKVVFW
jgi:sirohydrochlorin ferrochelatase